MSFACVSMILFGIRLELDRVGVEVDWSWSGVGREFGSFPYSRAGVVMRWSWIECGLELTSSRVGLRLE